MKTTVQDAINAAHARAFGNICREGPDFCCIDCGVSLSECEDCGGLGYHRDDCVQMEEQDGPERDDPMSSDKCSWCGELGSHQHDCVTQWRPGEVWTEADSRATEPEGWIGPRVQAWVVWDGVAFLRDDSRSYGAQVGVARVWTHDDARAKRYATREEAARVVANMRVERIEAFVKGAACSKVAL